MYREGYMFTIYGKPIKTSESILIDGIDIVKILQWYEGREISLSISEIKEEEEES